MTGLLAGIGTVLVVIGVAWWRENPSAERPASLLVLVGAGLMGAAWWLASRAPWVWSIMQ